MASEGTREQFRNLIGQVRANGAFPDEPLLAIFDQLQQRLAVLEEYQAKCNGIENNLAASIQENEELQAKLAELDGKYDKLSKAFAQRGVQLEARDEQIAELMGRLRKHECDQTPGSIYLTDNFGNPLP